MHKSKPSNKWARSLHHGKGHCEWRSCFQIAFWRTALCGPLSPLHFGYEIWWKSFLNEPKHWILKCMHHFKEASSWRPCSCMTWWSAVPLFTSWHHPHVNSNGKIAFATWNPWHWNGQKSIHTMASTCEIQWKIRFLQHRTHGHEMLKIHWEILMDTCF